MQFLRCIELLSLLSKNKMNDNRFIDHLFIIYLCDNRVNKEQMMTRICVKEGYNGALFMNEWKEEIPFEEIVDTSGNSFDTEW